MITCSPDLNFQSVFDSFSIGFKMHPSLKCLVLLSCKRQQVACKLFTKMGHGDKKHSYWFFKDESIHIWATEDSIIESIFMCDMGCCKQLKKKKREKKRFCLEGSSDLKCFCHPLKCWTWGSCAESSWGSGPSFGNCGREQEKQWVRVSSSGVPLVRHCCQLFHM